MRISDWSSDVCSSDLAQQAEVEASGDTIIIVTAQKREQNLQDVPASISVVGGETLIESGAAQISDLTGYVPGLHINNLGTPGQSRIALRGISPLGASASVGVYIDEAPVRSEARRVGNECVSTCRYRGSPDN